MLNSRYIIVLLFSIIFTQDSFAAGASSYTCVGKNLASRESIAFELLFSDHSPNAGYTNQSITISRLGSTSLNPPVTLQMFEATQKNNCQKNQSGEFYHFGSFEMDPTKSGNLAAFKVMFSSSCPQSTKFAVEAYCFHDHF